MEDNQPKSLLVAEEWASKRMTNMGFTLERAMAQSTASIILASKRLVAGNITNGDASSAHLALVELASKRPASRDTA